MPQQPKFIIVVGASAGGLNAMAELAAQLNENIDAAVFMVLHLSSIAVSDFLINKVQQYTSLPCSIARHNQSIEKGNIYIAPADFHMVIKKGQIVLGSGPQENRWRPSIDVMFRSAAAAYGEAVIGIILTGLLNDGTTGAVAIKRCGGTIIVQDPNEAEYPDMPLSALGAVEADYCVPLAQMGYILTDVVSNKQFTGVDIPQDIVIESAIAEKAATGIDVIQQIGVNSVYTCPDCGGGLWEITENGKRRYRCNIGHAYSEPELMDKQCEELQSALWVAVRMMEERNSLLKRVGNDDRTRGLRLIGDANLKKASELEVHIATLKKLLFEEYKK